MSIDAMASLLLRRNVFHPCDGGRLLLTMYFATVVWLTAIPSLSGCAVRPKTDWRGSSPERVGESLLMFLADRREDVICSANRPENQRDASGSPFPE